MRQQARRCGSGSGSRCAGSGAAAVLIAPARARPPSLLFSAAAATRAGGGTAAAAAAAASRGARRPRPFLLPPPRSSSSNNGISHSGGSNSSKNDAEDEQQQQQQQQQQHSAAVPRRDGPRRPRPFPHALDALPPLLAAPLAELRAYAERLSHLWGSFVPMASLFFLLSFVNTLLDSLKDTLIITSPGGGAHVLPFLSLYAVLPCSVLFLVAYAYASQRLSRAAVFNVIVGCFAAFFATFGLVLHPNAETLHSGAGLATFLARTLPPGLDGAVGMVRNWVFTLFYCAGELWGDVCMGLCFWTLANDTTALSDAPTLYPLLGVGANVAQAVAGMLLRAWNGGSSGGVGAAKGAAEALAASSASVSASSAAASAKVEAAAAAVAAADFVAQARALMFVIVALCGCALVVHHWITVRFAEAAARAEEAAAAAEAAEIEQARAAMARARALAAASAGADGRPSVEAREAAADAEARQRRLERRRRRKLRGDPREAPGGAAAMTLSASGSSSPSSSEGEEDEEDAAAAVVGSDGSDGSDGATDQQKKKKKPSLRETFTLLAGSVEIRCLAIMSLAQGLCSSLVEFCWKSHLRLLYPRPADFSAYLGGVAVWTGATTCALMLVSPVLFDRLGWRGVAGATPRVLAYGGGVFFAACIAYQHLHGAAAAAAAAAAISPPGAALLRALVASGAVLFVFSRGAKFSLFKPAEEMVYVTLGSAARTQGKAAIDVVGSQAGKSGGSLLQQGLLLLSGGMLTGIVPPMAGIFLLMLNGWRGAVDRLAVAREAQLAAVRHNLELTVDADDVSAAGEAGWAGAGADEVTRAAEEAIRAAKALGALQEEAGGGKAVANAAPPPPPPPTVAPAA